MTTAGHVNISRALDILGWMSEKELTWLAERASEHKIIVEFGSYHGRSTRALADNTDGVIYAVDPWNGDYFDNENRVMEGVYTNVQSQFCHNLHEHILSGKVIPVRTFSHTFEPTEFADMVFIDGDHRYRSVVKDIKKAIQITRQGALICGHDYGHPGWPGVMKAVNEHFHITRTMETIWWTVKH